MIILNTALSTGRVFVFIKKILLIQVVVNAFDKSGPVTVDQNKHILKVALELDTIDATVEELEGFIGNIPGN